MDDLKVLKHAFGAPGLRILGLGPNFLPHQGMKQLQKLFNKNALWAKGRNLKDMQRMLSKSDVIISIWTERQLIGFGRATSDGIFRATLWDIVVDKNFQDLGIGRQIVQLMLEDKIIKNVESIYLMTTNCEKFYTNVSFSKVDNQTLMKFQRKG